MSERGSDTDGWIVACPECATAFRINTSHLDVAAGLVRCGACLVVFDARALIEAERAALQAESEARASAEADARATQYLQEAAEAQAAADAEARAAAAAEQTAAATPATGSTPDDPVEHEDAGAAADRARQLVAEERAREDLARQAQAAEQRAGRSRIEPAAQVSDPHLAGAFAAAVTYALHAGRIEPARAAGPSYTELPDGRAAESAGAQARVDWLRMHREEDLERAPTIAPTIARELTRDLSAQLSRAAAPRRPLRRQGPWLALIGVACLGLVLQAAWWQFEVGAVHPQLRPLYAVACELLGCTLPEQRDLGAIRSRQLVVRSHPRVADALQVDAIVVNEASFAQRFPRLVLRFSDIRGETVAVRAFEPREYLAGELAGRRLMPAQTPIQISLEIRDPGDAAVNYLLAFR